MTIAIYVRLSLEDGTDQESASIVNQRHLLLDFIRNTPDLYGAKVVEYSDDGYSGKNFDRPGVQALLKAALSGEIQCILVKDDCVIIEPTQKDLENQGFVAGSICF